MDLVDELISRSLIREVDMRKLREYMSDVSKFTEYLLFDVIINWNNLEHYHQFVEVLNHTEQPVIAERTQHVIHAIFELQEK